MVIMMEKFVRASHEFYYIRWIAVSPLLVGLNLQLAVALTVRWLASHLIQKGVELVIGRCVVVAIQLC